MTDVSREGDQVALSLLAPSSGGGIYGGKNSLPIRSGGPYLFWRGPSSPRHSHVNLKGVASHAGLHLHSGGWLAIIRRWVAFVHTHFNAASRQTLAQDHDVDLRVPYSSGDRRPLYASRIPAALVAATHHRSRCRRIHQGFSGAYLHHDLRYVSKARFLR